ncbi:MAG TPA: hypothetical protein VHF88_08570 [Thermoleophilaceae bacterium]|nr:hypothetical protein [Thermoleophilaceae bacterium]
MSRLPHAAARELPEQDAVAAADLDDAARRARQRGDQLENVVGLAGGAELAPGAVAAGVIARRRVLALVDSAEVDFPSAC